jgi:uncharacterized protein YbbK (DUF523 family)/uncharacterized protein YbgA (DUF1722 family)
LLGAQVRFDGSHKRDRFLAQILDEHVDWVQVCPEVGAGMGVPRPTLRLVGDPAAPRLVVGSSGEDVTERVEAFSRTAIDRLAGLDLCGFVLKSSSPTCGMERVRVYAATGIPHKQGVGVFARALLERFPELPIEEEGRLHDPALREAFLDAVFAYARWRALAEQPFEPRALIEFHQRNKFLLRVHSPMHAAELGRLVARAGCRSHGGRARAAGPSGYGEYGRLFMRAVKVRATTRKHVAMLRRIAGHLRPCISDSARAVLHEAIGDYESGVTSRQVPLALLRHHAREQGLDYLGEQSYLDPYPKTLGRH